MAALLCHPSRCSGEFTFCWCAAKEGSELKEMPGKKEQILDTVVLVCLACKFLREDLMLFWLLYRAR